MNKPRRMSLIGNWPYVKGATRSFLRPSRKNRSSRQVVLLTSLLRLGITARGTHLTNLNKFDGGGSQVHQALAVKAFCRAFGIPYAHAPFARMEHASGPDEIAAWEHRFNLGEGCVTVADLGLNVVPVGRYLFAPSLWMKPVVLANVEVHPFINSNPEAYAPIRREAFEAYRGNSTSPQRPGAAVIAVHVRRGDVNPAKRERYTPDDRILSTIEITLQAAVRCGLTPQVTIFSQGEEAAFSVYADRGFSVSLDGDPLDAFDAMVNADVLVLAKSSLSYVAALLNQRAAIVYEPWRFAPMPDWDNREEDRERLIERLARKMEGNVAEGSTSRDNHCSY